MIEIIKEDITNLEVDAIINAANKSLLGGGGVDGAIHRKAGKELYKYCLKLNGCLTGEAKITPGFNLKAKYIIHTVAPIWYKGEENRCELLKNCYVNSFELALENNIKTIAFPCLGMGVYKVPTDVGGSIAIDTSLEYQDRFEKIYLVCFNDLDYDFYKKYLMEKQEMK